MDLKSGLPFSLIRFGLLHNYPKLITPVKTDVVIVGGGISGALTAYHLHKAGIDCVVVESRSIGLGSTCASTSLLQYEIDVSLIELSKIRGLHDATTSYHLCKEAIYKLKALAESIKMPEFKLNKSLYLATKKSDVAFLKEECNARHLQGFDVSYLDNDDIQKNFGFSSPGAILSADGACTDAYVFTHALHQDGMRTGLRVYDRTHVKKVEYNKGNIVLTTDENVNITAKRLIYATGYESVPLIKKKIVSLQSTYATVSEDMPNPLFCKDGEVILWNTDKPYLYMRRTSEGRTIVGGRDEDFYNPQKRDKLIGKKTKQLVRDFNHLFPEITFNAEFSWTGTFGSTADGLPYIGSYKPLPHTYFALGFGGNGITFSFIAAEILTDVLQGKKNAYEDIFSFDR